MGDPIDGAEARATMSRPLRSLIDVERAEADGEEIPAHVRRRFECQHALVVASFYYPMAVLASGLTSSNFDAPDYSLLWMAVERMVSSAGAGGIGHKIDYAQLLEYARKQGGRFRSPDGVNILLRMHSEPAVPLEYALTVLVKELRAADDLRVWADSAKRLVERASQSADPISLRQEWMVESQAIAQRYDSGPAATAIDDSAVNWRSKTAHGSIVATGFHEIDVATGGGLARGDMMVLGGGTNHGKSYGATKMLKNQASMGRSVLYISVEDSELLMVCRMLADYADPPLDPKRVRMTMTGLPGGADPLAIDGAAARMRAHQQGRIKTLHVPKAKLSTVCNAMRQHRYLHNVDMVIVDYLQAVQLDESTNNKTQDIAFITSELKKTAHEVGVALVVLSQYARDEYRDGAEPSVNSCKYAGDIENEAEVMLLLWRDEDAQLKGKLAKLKWASSLGHRYLIATHDTSGAWLDWTKDLEPQPAQNQNGSGGGSHGPRTGSKGGKGRP